MKRWFIVVAVLLVSVGISSLVVGGQKPFDGVTITVAVHSGHHATPWYDEAKNIQDQLGIKLNVVEISPEEIGNIDVVLITEVESLLNEIWHDTRENREQFMAQVERLAKKMVSKKMLLLANLMLFLIQSSHVPQASINQQVTSSMRPNVVTEITDNMSEFRSNLREVLEFYQTWSMKKEKNSRDNFGKTRDVKQSKYTELLAEYAKSTPKGTIFTSNVPTIENLQKDEKEEISLKLLSENYNTVNNVLQQRYHGNYVPLTTNQIVALAYKESSWDAKAKHKHSGAKGYVQLMRQTAKEMMEKLPGEKFDLSDKEDNLYLGLKYLDIKYSELSSIVDRINFDRVNAGKKPVNMHEEDFQALLLASYNAGACSIMGLFEEYLDRENITEFTWYHFSQYLQKWVDSTERLADEFNHPSNKFLTYPIPEEMLPYVKKDRGFVMTHKVRQFLHYVEFIRAFSGQLEEVEISLMKKENSILLNEDSKNTYLDLQLPHIELGGSVTGARNVA